MHILSKRLRRFRNILASELCHHYYTSKANLIARNCIFIHIPKNAGTSVAKAYGLPTTNHYMARELCWWMGKRGYEQFFTFCFVRNPYDRFLSLYHHARLSQSMHHSIHPDDTQRKHSDYDLLEHASLDDCARLLLECRLSTLWNPQTEWFLDKEGQIIVDYIGRYETLREDFSFLAQRIGGERILLPELNAPGRSSHYRDEFTDYARNAVERFYQQDIDMLGYSF